MSFQRFTSALFFNSNNNSENATTAPTSKLYGAAPEQPQRSALGEIGNKKTRKAGLSQRDVNCKQARFVHKPTVHTAVPTSRPSVRVLAARSSASTATSSTSSAFLFSGATAAAVDFRAPMDMDVMPATGGASSAGMQEDSLSAAALEVPEGVPDVDIDDGNPQLVHEYTKEIYAYMLELEQRHAVSADFLSKVETEMTPLLRASLIEWLVRIHLHFKLQQETMYVAVDILDRFLAIEPLAKSSAQLVGLTTLFIACKYEEMYPPSLRYFLHISENAHSKAEILRTEQLILKTLEYNLGTPLPLHFLRRYSTASSVCAQVHTTAKYLLELCSLDYQMTRYLPSMRAAAATWIARHVNLGDEEPSWNATLEHYSSYSIDSIQACILDMSVMLGGLGPFHNDIRRKYSSSHLWKVSRMKSLLAYAKQFAAQAAAAQEQQI